MVDLKQICDRLKFLGSQPETPEARAEVEAALLSKWEGVQAVAIRTLGRWGGRRSVELIKEWFLKNCAKKRVYGLHKVATEALSECFENEDVLWLLDTYFSAPSHVLYFNSIIFKIPSAMALVPAVRIRIIEESKNPDPAHRIQAVIAISALKFPDFSQLFNDLMNDANPMISNLAKGYLETAWLWS